MAERRDIVDWGAVVQRDNGSSELFGADMTVPLPATRASGEFDGLLPTLGFPHDSGSVFVDSDPALSY
jgi:hypothetical protein